MKKFSMLMMALLVIVFTLAGCAGTTVVINECSCPGNSDAVTPDADEPVDIPVTEGEGLKTGVAVMTTVSESTSATADEDGTVKYDITIAAVTVDENGMIQACRIDSVPANVTVNTAGEITSDPAAEIRTKNEQGADYGMVAYGGAVAEWDAQVAALCDYAIGMTVDELKNGAIDETGKAPEGSDLASSATIYLGGYVSAIEAAVKNAQVLGAAAGDELILATESTVGSSVAATAEAEGTAQLDTTIAAVTVKDGVVTSCIIDAVQAKVTFDQKGTITSDITAPIPTKNELGPDYGMVAYAGAIAEWNEQAASYAEYVVGKTAEEIAGIAVDESTKPADGSDLASSVTIAIGGFQSLMAKALAE